jgi:hypothetical protein
MSTTRGILKPYQLIDAETLSATRTTKTVYCIETEWVLFDFQWSSGVAADFVITIEYDRSNDDWVDVGVSSVPISISGASGTHQILIDPNIFTKLRAVVTRNAGSAIVTCTVSGKGT